MTITRTKFSQKDVARIKGLRAGGFCLALASYWARLVLQSEKDSWGVPTPTATDRLKTLDKKAVPLHRIHQQYLERQDKVRENAVQLESLILVAKSGFLELGDRGNLVEYLKTKTEESEKFGIVSVKGIDLQRSAIKAMRAVGLTPKTVTAVKVTTLEAATTLVETTVEKEATYVIEPKHGTTKQEHAMAIYRTAGVFSTYRYIFDPNFGEWLATTKEDAAKVINTLMGGESPYKTKQWNLICCTA